MIGCLKVWLAVPPMWNVRIVNCVPGSPIDCAATHSTNDALTKIDNFLVALVNRAHDDTIYGPAIILVDDHVLRGVHQFTSKISRICRFKCRVGKSFARSVRRDEILEHAQALSKVRSNGSLDDFSRWFGHQTEHARELPHLLPISA